MGKAVVAAAVGGVILGLLVGILWWQRPLQRSREDLRALQGQQAAAEVAREALKAAQDRLKQIEEELRLEKERRARLEAIVSQGRK
jgi:hypothetical protein